MMLTRERPDADASQATGFGFIQTELSLPNVEQQQATHEREGRGDEGDEAAPEKHMMRL